MTTPDVHGNIHKGKGSPDGGQFAEKRNAAPTQTLTDEQVREMNATIMGPAAALTRAYRIDPSTADDIAQDAWVELLAGRRPIEELVGEKKLLKAVARTVAVRQTVGHQHGLRHEEFQARRALKEQEAAFEGERGRKMTPSEREAAADKIRMSMKPGRRPKPDFYRERSTVSLDAPVRTDDGDGDTTLGVALVADQPLPFDDQEDAAASALFEFENGGAAGKVDVRRDVWRIVSIRNGAPAVKRESLSKSAASTARRVVNEYPGGAHALALRWVDGDATDEQEKALFAPFGELSVHERHLTAEVMEDHPDFADSLWREALKAATRR